MYETKRRRWPLVLSIILLVLIIALGGAVFFYQKIYNGKRWYPHTTINGVDVSGQSLEQSKETIRDLHANYSLHISGRDDGSLVIDGGAIDYDFQLGDHIDKLYEDQHQKFVLTTRKSDYETVYDVKYDRKKLVKAVSCSAILAGSYDYHVQKPVSARAVFDKESGQYTIAAEKQGNKLRKKALIAAIETALAQADTEMDLTDVKEYPDIYASPKITSDDPSMQQAVSTCNNVALRYIVWNMGEGHKETITPKKIAQWISYKDGTVTYDETAIAAWVEQFCLKYKTVGKNRTIKDHNGKNVTIIGGDYGWQMDYEKTVKQAVKAIKQPIDQEATNAYLADPSEENKKALTIKKGVLWLYTGFKMEYDQTGVDWDVNNYTEISIKDQMVYVMRNGKVKFSCHCITGLPVEGRSTPTGAYYVKEHKEAYTLTGPGYATPVKNWVRITWSGTGFHPATWQPWSSWNKNLYKTRGSHGCINLNPTDAVKIYKLVPYREAVFIH